jgi:hypothetical protein
MNKWIDRGVGHGSTSELLAAEVHTHAMLMLEVYNNAVSLFPSCTNLCHSTLQLSSLALNPG